MSGKQVLASLLVKMLIDWVCLGVLGGWVGHKVKNKALLHQPDRLIDPGHSALEWTTLDLLSNSAKDIIYMDSTLPHNLLAI